MCTNLGLNACVGGGGGSPKPGEPVTIFASQWCPEGGGRCMRQYGKITWGGLRQVCILSADSVVMSRASAILK